VLHPTQEQFDVLAEAALDEAVKVEAYRNLSAKLMKLILDTGTPYQKKHAGTSLNECKIDLSARDPEPEGGLLQ
jgi:hypothetical protein